MARPTTKNDLLEAAETGYEKLFELINTLSPEEQMGIFQFEDRDRNIRDVLIHLHEWQNMMKLWYGVGMSGEMPVTPAPGYTWRTTPELNQKIWKAYQDTSLEEAKKLLTGTHREIMELIKKHSNEELFSKNIYPWTKTSTLGSYLISSTSSHYDWAIKKIKKYIRGLKDERK